MTITNPINLKILSKMIVSDRPDQLSDQLDGETVTIYDNSGGIYLQDVYNNKNTYTSNKNNHTNNKNNHAYNKNNNDNNPRRIRRLLST